MTMLAVDFGWVLQYAQMLGLGLAGIAAVITTLLVEHFTETRMWAVKFWGFCLVVLQLVYDGLMLVGDLTIRAGQQVVNLFTRAGDAPCATGLGTFMAIANTFFPVDETLRLMAATIVAIWLPVSLYRLVKSWIPGLGGGS